MMKISSIKKLSALVVTAALLFAGCSGGKDKTVVDVKPDDAAASLVEAVQFKDTLVKAEGGAAEMYYRLDDNVAEYAIYVSGSGGTAEEVAVLKMKDPAKLKEGQAIIEKRVDDLKFRFEDYVPEEMVKLGAPVIVAKGDVVVLVVADDAAAAKKAVDALFA